MHIGCGTSGGGRRRRQTRLVALAVGLAAGGAALLNARPAVGSILFAPGDIVVTRAAGGTTGVDESSVGAPGSGALSGSGVTAAVFVEGYSPAGTPTGTSIALPYNSSQATGGNNILTFSGTQNLEGAITATADGKFFMVAGYKQSAYVTGVSSNGSAANVVNRVVGRIGVDGSVNTTTALTDAMSQQSIRSAYSTNGTDLWVTGNGGNAITTITTSGIHYATVGSTTSVQLNGAGLTANNRVLNGFGGQLFVSNGNTSSPNAPARGVDYVRDATTDNTPVTPTNTTNQLFSEGGFPTGTNGSPTPSNPQPDDFWFKDADTLYLADNRIDASNLGGIEKWIRTAGSGTGALGDDVWSLAYTLPLGATGIVTPNANNGGVVGAHGLAGTFDGTTTTLYATSFEAGGTQNRLWAITDGGSLAGSTSTLLALSAPNSAFRGVEVVPTPEPSSAVVMIIAGAGLAARRRNRR
jgi:hypothetical protein